MKSNRSSTSLIFLASYATVALATLVTIARSVPELDRCAESAFLGRTMLSAGGIAAAFGPETAAMAAPGGAIGWLGDVVHALLVASPVGLGTCAMLAVLSALGTFAFVALRVRALVPAPFAIGAVLVVFATSFDALHLGGSTAMLFFTAAFVAVLDLATPTGIALAAIVAIAWCNVDASGVLAPILAVASLVGRSFGVRSAPELRPASLTAGVAVAALFTTPSGLAYPRLALASLRLVGTFGDSVGWAPIDVAPVAYRLGFTALIFAALAFGVRARGPREATLAIVAIVLALSSGALLPIAAIVVAPTLAVAAADLVRGRARERDLDVAKTIGMVPYFVAIVVVALAGSLVVGARVGAESSRANEPQRSLRELARRDDIRRVACSEVVWCDGAVALGLRVLADDRIGAMPAAVRRAQARISRARIGWRVDVGRYGVDAIVTTPRTALTTLLVESGWTRVSHAGSVAVFVRPGRGS